MIIFWECLSSAKWIHYSIIEKKTKQFNYIPNFSCKSLARKRNVTLSFKIGKWHLKHQIIRGIISLIFLIMSIFLSNLYILRAVLGLNYLGTLTCYMQEQQEQSLIMLWQTNITWGFFPKELFKCLWGLYPIESTYYILYEYRKYNNYWNLKRESLKYFVAFLKFNPGAFSFYKDITW